MDRGVRLALLCMSLFLVVFPLTVGKPGLPVTLKADEPAYYLMAMSLAHDGDLLCEAQDLRRLQAEYPFMHTENLIIMSRDGWRTIFFGKPYIYPLLAAPLARFAGANALVAVNMALFLAMVAMGTAYLARFNPVPVAALFAGGFFFVSSAFAYVFWLQPEIFSMAAVMASLWLIVHRPEAVNGGRAGLLRRLLAPPAVRAGLAGGALALAAYNKPAFAAMALPAAWELVAPGLGLARGRGHRWPEAAAWVGGFALAGLLAVGGSLALTGQASAYLGAARRGVNISDPEKPPRQPLPVSPGTQPARVNSWGWIFHGPDLPPGLAREVGYFLWGRHTGLLPYLPFAGVALLLFLLHGRRSGCRWAILAGLVAVAVFFLVWIPFNWYGGGGFVGNRYFVSVYPAFLFLVTRVRPLWLLPAGWTAGGLFLGSIVFTPFGAPVPKPTLQAHVRNPPFSWLPLELSHLTRIPGYQGVSLLQAHFIGRKDVFERNGDELWVRGGPPAELWLETKAPLEAAVFRVRSESSENHVRLDLAGAGADLRFTAGGDPFQYAVLAPDGPTAVAKGRNIYRLRVSCERGRLPPGEFGRADRFYLGAALTYLGTQDPRDQDLYALLWGDCRAPAAVAAGEDFTASAVLTNRSADAWLAEGPVRVSLAYHWLTPDGELVEVDGRRTPLPHRVEPGETIEVVMAARAPAQPGRYLLELDPLIENVSWFSQKNGGATRRLPVEVMPAATTQAAARGTTSREPPPQVER